MRRRDRRSCCCLIIRRLRVPRFLFWRLRSAGLASARHLDWSRGPAEPACAGRGNLWWTEIEVRFRMKKSVEEVLDCSRALLFMSKETVTAFRAAHAPCIDRRTATQREVQMATTFDRRRRAGEKKNGTRRCFDYYDSSHLSAEALAFFFDASRPRLRIRRSERSIQRGGKNGERGQRRAEAAHVRPIIVRPERRPFSLCRLSK